MKRHTATFLFVSLLASAGAAQACTAFLAARGDTVLVGNNEDAINPRTKVWFVPAENGQLGRVYFGFDDFSPQGGMNERGLFFDGFATAPRKVVRSADKPVYPGDLADKAMAECTTVDEVLALFDKYNLERMERVMLMFGDATGDSAIIEGDNVVRKKGRFQVVTNFRQSQTPIGLETCERYKTAVRMLSESEAVSVPLFRRILAGVHVERDSWTLYSNVYDLNRRIVHVYHFHNFENVVTFDLSEELKKGRHSLDLPSLFPLTFAAEDFARKQIRDLEEQKKVKPATGIDPVIYDRYTGKYELLDGPTPGVVVTVLREADKLYIDVPGTAKFELSPESPTDFYYLTFGTFFRLSFTRGDQGDITGFTANVDGTKVHGKRTQ